MCPEPTAEIVYELLRDVVGDLPMEGWNYRRYWEWEQEVAEPALEDAGFRISGWTTKEADSFGPLCRCVHVIKDGVVRHLIYN